ncbi:MAG: efflux RND transporter periplasmic adaptor subunit [Bacteroidota bacterium]
MKKSKWIAIIIITIIVVVAIWLLFFRKAEEVIILETEKVAYGSVTNTITAIGTLQPVDTVAVGSQISGTIKKVFADFNSTVKKGQLLVQIDKSLTQAQVEQYTALLQQAQANVVYQKSNFDRQNKLYTVGAISKADLETATYQYNSAKDNVNSISAQLRTAQKNLSFTDIYSPIDGTVLSRSVSEGQTVAASLNTPTLFSIAKDLTKMQVQASVDEADIGGVKEGQRVIFTVDAFPTDTFAGKVKEIRLRSSVSANVVTYITIIDAPNADMKLKPGMTANITIYTREVNNVLTIPAAALVFTPDSLLIEKFHLSLDKPVRKQGGGRQGGGKRQNRSRINADSMGIPVNKGLVWIKKDSLTIISRPVFTGLDDKTIVQVISGLKEGEEVITGYLKVKKKDAAAAKSPFMPARNNNRRRPAGGGGGGGGGQR